jgi:hypothetical protein
VIGCTKYPNVVLLYFYSANWTWHPIRYSEAKNDPCRNTKLVSKSRHGESKTEGNGTYPTANISSSTAVSLGFRPAKKWIYDDDFAVSTDDEWVDSFSSDSSSSVSTPPSNALSRLGAFGIDPFMTLPGDSSPQVDGLICHCRSSPFKLNESCKFSAASPIAAR